MSKNNVARDLVAAALASALTLAGVAAPVLAAPATAEVTITAPSPWLDEAEALYIAESRTMVAADHVDWFDCRRVTFEGHECYEVTFHEGLRYDAGLDQIVGDQTHVVYVGAETGTVYGERTEG